MGEGCKLGVFVEAKNAQIGRGYKVPHLTYIGDATVGEESNIGASSVFVNYDGVNKHHTNIGSHVRRSEERRVGKECRSRRSTEHEKTKKVGETSRSGDEGKRADAGHGVTR